MTWKWDADGTTRTSTNEIHLVEQLHRTGDFSANSFMTFNFEWRMCRVEWREIGVKRFSTSARTNTKQQISRRRNAMQKRWQFQQ